MTALDLHDDPLALESLLRWYVAMGVDMAIDETPHDRFSSPRRDPAPDEKPATGASEPRQIPAPGEASRRPVPVVATEGTPTSADALIRQAEAIAAAAETLDALRTAWATLPGCHLSTTATQMIFEGGTRGAPIMLIGGAPDSDDERRGEAFAGVAGHLLDAMLRAIGFDRSHVYLGNVIPWRPPGNRAPTPLELALCLPFIRRQIALAAPETLVCLGEKAAQPLLASKEPISRLRGRWWRHEGQTEVVRTLVTFSPDYLLKQPLQKRRAWVDLRMLAASRNGHESPPGDADA